MAVQKRLVTSFRDSLPEGRIGRLILVVGPSGAGKDSLIRAARERLAGDRGIMFARRDITRAGGDVHEDHVPVDPDTFAEREQRGGYILSWRAHGHGYGIPASFGLALLGGTDVVANVSRSVLAAAAGRWPIKVILVTASPEALAARLAERGREDAAAVADRLARAGMPLDIAPTVTITNDERFEDALDAFVTAIRQGAGARPAPAVSPV